MFAALEIATGRVTIAVTWHRRPVLRILNQVAEAALVRDWMRTAPVTSRCGV